MFKFINPDDTLAILKRQHESGRNEDSFHNAIGPVFVIAQFFGQIPLCGIRKTKVMYLKYTLKSFRGIFSHILLMLFAIETGLGIYQSTMAGINLGNAAGIIFLGSNLLGSFFLLLISQQWPKLIRLWYRSEQIFLRVPYRLNGLTLTWKIRIVAFTFFLFALSEHCMYLASAMYKNYKQITYCNLTVNFVENFFLRERTHIFTIIPYSHYLILPLQYINISMTFCWTFVDVFIMIISIGIATRFNQISDRLKLARGKLMPESYWIEIRTHYLILTELLQYVDKRISPLILLSCTNNLYFICFQLFNSFNEIPFLISKIYFWQALFFIIGRTMCTLFFAASINDASRRPISVLRNVPAKGWSLEVQRFTDQVVNEVVALSGKRFFYLRRKLILAMAGTVATYELVLVDQIEPTPFKPNSCD